MKQIHQPMNAITAYSISKVVRNDEIIGGEIRIKTEDPDLRVKLEADYELMLKVWMIVTAGGIAECMYQMQSRKLGTLEELMHTLGELIAMHTLSREKGLEGGLMG
jgi:hypothetical protein